MPTPVRRVAVLLGSSLGWREKVMRGIASYAHEHGPWHVYTSPEGTEDSLFFSENYRWDGMIVRIVSDRHALRIRRRGVPAVSVGSVKMRGRDLPRVKVDDEQLSRLAVNHLIAGGLRHFGYCSFYPGRGEDRGPAFARLLAEQGLDCSHYGEFTRLPPTGAAWQKRQRDLARWLRSLPKPAGVFTWNADVACQVVEACHVAELAVPQQVAVVSGDEDLAKCELSSPTVSAVEIPAVRIGHEAAALLDRLMAGAPAPTEPVLVAPSGIVTVRESSNTARLEDWDVHRAVQYMRENAGKPITVAEVAQSVQVSRRWLERHFRQVLGRSPHEELRMARVEQAKRLLLDTDWPMLRVAQASGLTSASYLNFVFRQDTGLTPAQFRERYRST
jgi:LacI family transcriptional regulator